MHMRVFSIYLVTYCKFKGIFILSFLKSEVRILHQFYVYKYFVMYLYHVYVFEG